MGVGAGRSGDGGNDRYSHQPGGAPTFGEDWGWGASPDVSARMLDLFADPGGNVIDTADVYTNGTSEAILGELLQERRDRFVLGTKFTNQTDPGDPNSAGNHRKKIVTSIEASLRRLQTDHIDLYWGRNRDVLTGVEELMRARDDPVRLGKVLYPAVSDWAAWEIAEANTAARLRDGSPLGFPADVMREASVVAGIYGAQLPDIDDPRAQAVRRTTTGTRMVGPH